MSFCIETGEVEKSMCQLLGMNCNTPTDITFSFEGFAKRWGISTRQMLASCVLLLALFSPLSNVSAKSESFTSDFTTLYAKPNPSAHVLGIFDASARVTLIDENNWEWVEVIADNGMRGFVHSTLLTQHPMGAQKATPEPFIPADGDYGSAHLVVNVAGLKARLNPASPKVACILTMGTVVGVDFIPTDGQAWVNIGTCENNQTAYVQRQFLGKHPDIQAIFRQYDALPASDVAMRKTLAERAVELAWNLGSASEHIKPALTRFMSVARDLNNDALITNTELSMRLLDSLQNHLSYDEQMAQTSTGKVTYAAHVAGLPVNNEDAPKLSQVKQVLGLPMQIKTETDYCGDDRGDKSYVYPHATLLVDEKKGLTSLSDMRFAGEGNAFVFKGARFDKNTTEQTFVEKTHGWIDASPSRNPHAYWLNDGDWAVHRFYFRDGYLFSYSFGVLC